MSLIQFSSSRNLLNIGIGAIVLSCCVPSYSQAANAAPQAAPVEAAPAVAKASDILQPTLSHISQVITSLNIARWKAPNEVRAATQQNADSIQRDLSGTLPGLLTAADAAPSQVSAVFPVYRNIDALYDVLLRVSETAGLAAPQQEMSDISSALQQLEAARTNLGNAIFTASKNNEATTIKLQATVQQQATAAQAAATPAKTTVVDDGPVKSTTRKKKKKPATPAPATTQPAPQQ